MVIFMDIIGQNQMLTAENGVAYCNGTHLPTSILSNIWKCSTHPGVVIGHGLGSSNPKLKSHTSDKWATILATSCSKKGNPVVLYTARGHGDSSGWETTAEDDMEQFTWKRLASDMISVADHYNLNKIVVAGSSMGSATALYAAIENPSRIVGVILLRAWESRKERSKNLASSAKKCKLENPSSKYHFVLRGTALSDLPSIDDPVYSTINCPVLILAIEGDDAHPLSTATKLLELLKNSELFVSKSHKDASEEWPALIDRFMDKLIPVDIIT
mmetsp:Transcript_19371/g.26619  ORF Transcript_19371/g.26619 Transcript_19371/m.26619 type:complete len:272 (-) Transcript_19371:1371-2186(-)